MEIQKHRSYTFGTWNVRGLSEKKREAFSEIRRENEDVVVLTETKLRGVGEEDLEDYIHLYSGIASGPARAGVSILLKKELANNLKWRSVSERLIVAEFKISGRSVVVIGVYWLDDCAKSAMKDSFQNNLKSIVENVDKEHELVILGDFNSRVGVDKNSSVVGSYGEPEINNNGRRLTELCKYLNLKIQNTFFNHEDKHKYTWYHPRQSRRTLIDFCITRQDTSFFVEDVVACRWLECGTDHIFLEATLSFQLQDEDERPVEHEDIADLRKYRTYLLYSKSIRTSYKDYLETAIDVSVPRTTEELYQCLKNSIHSAAFHLVGSERKDQFGEFLWDQEVRDLREFRKIRKGQFETDKLVSGKNITESQFRNIKNKVWEGICSEIDNTDKFRRNKALWNIINDLQNKSPRTSLTNSEWFVYEPSPKTNKNDKEPSLPLNCLNISNKFDPDKVMKINVHNVCKALDHMEDCNVPSPGGLTVKLLKHSSDKSKILLTNLIQNIFNGDIIPAEITEMYFINILRVNGEIFIPNIGNCFMHSIMRLMRVVLKNMLEKYTSFEDIGQVIPIESYSDATFILRQILQKSVDKQTPPFHFVFIDLINSFFDIGHTKLFEFLAEESIPDKLIAVIRHLYDENNIIIVESGRVLEDPFLNNGLTYDFSLSCMLLKMYLKKALKAWSEENSKYGVAIGNKRLLSLFLCDSKMVIVSENKQNMELIIASLRLHLQHIGLSLNHKNIKYLSKENLEIDNNIIEGKEIMNFYDSILELDGRNVEEIFQRVLDTNEAIRILHPVARDGTITKKNKSRIFRSIIRSLLVYGCETWTITEDLKKPFEDTELRYWKWCCENYPYRYTKQEIYDLMNVKEAVSRIIMLKKAAWYTSIMESDTASWVRNILDWEPDGVLRCGRPRKKWMDGLEDFLKSFQNYQADFQKNKHVRRRNSLTTIQNVITDTIEEEKKFDLQP